MLTFQDIKDYIDQIHQFADKIKTDVLEEERLTESQREFYKGLDKKYYQGIINYYSEGFTRFDNLDAITYNELRNAILGFYSYDYSRVFDKIKLILRWNADRTVTLASSIPPDGYYCAPVVSELKESLFVDSSIPRQYTAEDFAKSEDESEIKEVVEEGDNNENS
jgi:hypothetical protein